MPERLGYSLMGRSHHAGGDRLVCGKPV